MSGFDEAAALDAALQRVETSGEAFFAALHISSKNAAQLGHEAMREIRKLEGELERTGATGLSLLVGSKNMEGPELNQKLAELDEQVKTKESQRRKLHSNLVVLEQELTSRPN